MLFNPILSGVKVAVLFGVKEGGRLGLMSRG